MFQLVHISDIHLTPLPTPSWRQLMNKRITGYLNWKFNRGSEMESNTFDVLAEHFLKQQADHTAISGDIVNLSLDAEFARAQARLSQLGRSDDISLVPGNHDAYVPGALARACKAFSPWIAGETVRKGALFPYMRVRGAAAIIGVSSAVATVPFSAAGYFGRQQAQDLALLLQQAGEAGLFRIVMIHHPPLFHATGWGKRLWGIRRFQQVIANCGAELVLHGHTHVPTLSFIAGQNNRVPVVGVASASQDFGGHKPPAGYNLFKISRKNHSGWQCHMTRRALINADGQIDTFMSKALYE